MTGDKKDELLVATGKYWSGKLALFRQSEAGLTQIGKPLDFNGRPVGIAIGNFFKGINTALIVDYWNSKIFFAGVEDNQLTLLPGEIELPGKPVLAAFGNPDGEGTLGVAVVCPREGLVVVCDAPAGADPVIVRQFPIPLETLWKQIHMVDMDHNPENSWAELILVRLGKSKPNVYISGLDKEKADWKACNVGVGLTRESAVGNIAGSDLPQPRSDLAVLTGAKKTFLYTLIGSPPGETKQAAPVSFGVDADIIGAAVADLDGNGKSDFLVLQKDRIICRFRGPQGEHLKPVAMRLPNNTPPLGAYAIGEFSPGRGEELIIIDRAGRLLKVTVPGIK